MTTLFTLLGQFVRKRLERWWTVQRNLPPALLLPLVLDNEPTWSETSDNWHENPEFYIWHEAPTNEWEAAMLPDGWLDFTPPPPKMTTLERRRAEYNQIKNLKA